MITRQDIENEAAFIQKLIDVQNPTGGKYTPTPWRKRADDGGEISDLPPISAFLRHMANARAHTILDQTGEPLAIFKSEADRDLALYFANSHAAIIGMLRGEAAAWDFAHGATSDAGFQSYAAARADNLRVYADLFCRLGVPDPLTEPQSSA